MTAEEKYLSLYGTIGEILAKGVTLNDDVMHYIDSTFLSPSTGELKALLEEEDNPDRDPLMELIFFPDEPVQVALEAALEALELTEADETGFIRFFQSRDARVPLLLPDGGRLITIEMPVSVRSQFISRLKIGRRLPAEVRKTVESLVEETEKDRVKVMLRKAAPLSGEKVDFMCRFFEKLPPRGRMFFDSLAFILEFLPETETAAPTFDSLIARKNVDYQGIRRADKFERDLQKDNIETLMLRGVTGISIDRKACEGRMAVIDHICRKLYGKTEFFGEMPRQQDLGNFNGEGDLDSLLKSLS